MATTVTTLTSTKPKRKAGEPKTLTVFGAGLEAANGVYRFVGRDEKHGDTPRFAKKKTLDDGKECSFWIAFSSQERRWYLVTYVAGETSHKARFASNRVSNCQ